MDRGIGMGKKGTQITLLAAGIYFACYLTATIQQSDFWGNLLSPAGALFSAAIILHAFYCAKKPDFRRWVWLFLSLAFISWAIADILWLIDAAFSGKDPGSNMLTVYFYFGTNLFLLTAIIIFAVKVFRGWNAIQLIVDSTAIALSILFLFWILFFDKQLSRLGMLTNDGWVTGATMAIDFAVLVGVCVWYLSIRGGTIPLGVRLIAGFVLLFDLVDIMYYYFYMSGNYNPNSIIDALYMASFLGISLSVLIISSSGKYDGSYVETPVNSYTQKKYRYKGWVLLLLPLIVLTKGFNLTDLLISIFVISVHFVFSGYIQNVIKNELLLKREMALNTDLEQRISDRTKELVEKNALLDYISNQDTVTSLYNRRYFLQELDKRVRLMKPDETLSLIFIDVDRFKTINDSYGHYVGDHILIELAKRIQTFENPMTLIARLGGDEFVIAYQGKHTLLQAESKAKEVVQVCSEDIHVEEYSFRMTISIGISMYPIDAGSSDMLMRNADMAMYQAKKEGYNKVVAFNEILTQTIRHKNIIEFAMKNADFDKEFELYFQPQFTIPDKKMIGMEALLRWNCPGSGFISPAEFIPIAEETNWIIPIGEWVMAKAIDQIAKWNIKYKTNLKMGINVSPKQLDQSDFSQYLAYILGTSGVPPEWIDVEITEGISMEGSCKIDRIAELFKNSGITISIDDFGTGYSSLSYLKNFPFDRVKIDLSLIDTITANRYDRQIVRSIILLASSIGMESIAEGVETKEQFDLLAELGCKQMQGNYLARPMPADKFEELFLQTKSHIDIINYPKSDFVV